MSSTLLPITSAGGVTSESFSFANGAPVSLAPYVTINEGTGNINATATIQLIGDTTGYIVSVDSSNNNYNLFFNRAVGDADGNMYVIGGNQDNDKASIWSFNADGALRWSCGVDNIGGERVEVDSLQFNPDNDTITVSLEWWDGTSDQDGILVLNAADGTYVSSTLLSTPTNANPSIGDIALMSDGTPVAVGQIQGDFVQTNSLTAQTPSGIDQLWLNNSDLPIAVDPGNSPSWEIDTSGGTGSPNWVSTGNINFLYNLPTETMTGSGTGATVSVRWTGVTNTYDYEYVNNGGSGYATGDRIRVRGSNLGGTDNTDITATATSSSDVGANTVAVFDKATYPTLGSVQVDWYAFFPSGLAYRVAIAPVDTGTTWEIAVESNGVDFSGQFFFTGGGNDCIMYAGYAGGSLSWVANVWPGTSVPKALFTLNNGTDFAVVGATWSVKYSLDGQASVWTPNWQHTYGATDWQQFVSVACDQSDDSVYMLGNFYTYTPERRRASVIKLNSAGTTQWSKYIDDGSTPGGNPGSIAIDSNSNVYIIGVNDNDYTIVTKLDSNGSIIWQSRQTNNSNWDNEPRGAVDADGNVYIFGSWYNNDIGEDIYSLMKLNSADGTLAWARFITNTENYSFREFYNDDSQTISVQGNTIYWAGYVNDTENDYYDAVAGKMPTDGTILGTYGRFIYQNDPTAEFEDNTSNAIAEDNATGVPVDVVTQTVTGSSASVTAGDVGSDNVYAVGTMMTGGGGIVFSDGSIQTTAAGAGTITSINNGTSNVTIADAGGNIVISVDDNNMTWKFATDRTIYGKENENITIAAVDTYNDGYQVRQIVSDGNQDLSRTSLDRYSFNIQTNLNTGHQWSFNSNELQVQQDSRIYGFNSSVRLAAMHAGGNPVASLQSVSNQNDPNVFTTLDATTTGANIKVYNGGSVSGTEHVWQFTNEGVYKSPVLTVATLPSVVSGLRAFVSDSNLAAAGNFGAVVTGGGSNSVPVWSDGTNWMIG